MNARPKVCFSAGHGLGSRHEGQIDPGAEFIGVGPDEAGVALGMASRLNSDCAVLFAGHTGTLHMLRDRGLYYLADDEAAAKGCDLFLELHTNASVYNPHPDGKSLGVEVLYNDPADEAFAADMSARIARAAGLPNRGAKHRTDLAVLRPHAGMTQVIVELCFGTDADDVAHYQSNVDKIEVEILNACLFKWRWPRVGAPPRKWGYADRTSYAKQFAAAG